MTPRNSSGQGAQLIMEETAACKASSTQHKSTTITQLTTTHDSLLPAYVVLGSLRDKAYALQHISDVVYSSFLNMKCLCSLV